MSACDSTPCQNKGICFESDDMQSFICLCQPGWEGPFCAGDIDDCEGHPCENNSTCVDMIDDYQCDCLPGFGGPLCGIGIHGNG